MKNGEKAPEIAEAPHNFRGFLWFIKNWKTYWRELIGFALVCFIVFIFVQCGAASIVDLIRSHFASVTVKVIHFNYSTGEVTLEFNNKTLSPVPVDMAYITLAPTNSVPAKPLPPDLQRLVSVFAKNVMRIPSEAGIEFERISGKTEMKGHLLRMAVLLIRQTPPVVLQPGTTSTNIAPRGTAFSDICGQFMEGAELEIMLHTSLIDQKGRARRQEIALGNYFIGKNLTGLKRAPHPKEVDVLRKTKVGGSAREQTVYNFSGTMEMPPLDDKVQSAFFENLAPSEILVTVGTRVTGLVPAILIKKSISYGCLFKVELKKDEQLPSDFAAWILTRDGGKTVMNVPMAFSDNWSNVQSVPTPEKEYTIPLPSTNWQVLIDGQRWARIEEGVIKYTVKEKTWIKLLPADDATTSLLSSNYNRIALQEVSDDPSWVPLTNAINMSENAKTFLIVQNEVSPDLSMFSTLLQSSNPSTNAYTDNLPDDQTKGAKESGR